MLAELWTPDAVPTPESAAIPPIVAEFDKSAGGAVSNVHAAIVVAWAAAPSASNEPVAMRVRVFILFSLVFMSKFCQLAKKSVFRILTNPCRAISLYRFIDTLRCESWVRFGFLM